MTFVVYLKFYFVTENGIDEMDDRPTMKLMSDSDDSDDDLVCIKFLSKSNST